MSPQTTTLAFYTHTYIHPNCERQSLVKKYLSFNSTMAKKRKGGKTINVHNSTILCLLISQPIIIRTLLTRI